MSSDIRAKSKEQIAKELQQQIFDLTEALQRERADVINVRRRHDEQISSLKSMVKANVVQDLLPVIDNLDRALKHKPANSGQRTADSKDDKLNDWVKGVMSIKAQFDKMLENMGVTKIKTLGEPFNPHLHEAVSHDGGDGEHEVVSEELQSGYVLGDSVIRHAMVKVKKANK